MSRFVYHDEKEIVWSFDEDDIMHRWQLFIEFDPLYRLFGDKTKNPDGTYRAKSKMKSPNVTNEALIDKVLGLS